MNTTVPTVAQKWIEELVKMRRYIDSNKLIDFCNNHISKTIDANDIARFPTADVVEVKHGKWVDTDCSGYLHNPIYECSVCHKQVEDYYIHKHNFCLHCGARMDGDSE